MGQLRKSSVGNIDLKELSRIIKENMEINI